METILQTESGQIGLGIKYHPGQLLALNSKKRFILLLAGTQGGKTIMGPRWLFEEIQRVGPGDYLYVGPTLKLLRKKAIPEFKRVFQTQLKLGRFNESNFEFHISDAGQQKLFGRIDKDTSTIIRFGYATDPESLESATVKAAVLDECGQKTFKLGSWEAIIRRLSLQRGRVLMCTTPYNLGWLKQHIYDPWRKAPELPPWRGSLQVSTGEWLNFSIARHDHPDIEVINFASVMNPVFPMEEFHERRAALPWWKFQMFYLGLFTRPAGLIYDMFDEDAHKIRPFPIPPTWPRYIGLDFGAVNFAALFYAQDPGTNTLYAYREYRTGRKTAAEHVKTMIMGEPTNMLRRVHGGSRGEHNWRAEFAAAGLNVTGPSIVEVEVGLDRVAGLHNVTKAWPGTPSRTNGGVYVFSNLTGYLEEKLTYARELDANDEPTDKIADKATFHGMDSERYILQELSTQLSQGAYTLVRA